MMMPLRPGSVTCQSWRSRPAPSTLAASYNSGSIWDSAARNRIVAQPVSFQMICEVSRAWKTSGLPMMLTVPRSCDRRKLLSMPLPPSSCWNSDTTITQDRKCGR